MKILQIKFEEAVDISPLPVGTAVTVSNGTTTIDGKVMATIHTEEPPTLEGDYHIEPVS